MEKKKKFKFKLRVLNFGVWVMTQMARETERVLRMWVCLEVRRAKRFLRLYRVVTTYNIEETDLTQHMSPSL